MNARRMTIAASLALSAVASSSAMAQGKGQNQKQGDDKCTLDFNSSDQVRNAYNNITVLQISKPKPEDAKKRLHDAVNELTKQPDKIKDQAARDYVLGAALVSWYQLPGTPPVAKRGDLGYATNPDQTVDILAAADTAFSAVEQAKPDCADRTAMFRQQPWVKMINQVGPLLNANQTDSAAAVLQRATTIYRGSPFTYYFEGQVAQRKKDWAGAAAAYEKAAELATPEMAAKDSNLANIKEFSEFATAFAQLQVAQAQSGDQQKASMKAAADKYRAYLKDYPHGENQQQAQAGLSVALQSSGDTAAISSMWNQMAANPSQYSDGQLYDAGTQAFQAKDYKRAVQLMELGQQANPWLRGGLFNLANAYWKNNQFDKMVPVVRRLLEIDPDNPDNYQLMAIAYQGQEKSATPKEKRLLQDSVTKYVTAADKLPIHFSFTGFTHDSASAKLSGTAENAASTPKNVTLTVQFLDKGGNVVATQTAPLSVPAKGTKSFSVDAQGKNIAAFRYAPVK